MTRLKWSPRSRARLVNRRSQSFYKSPAYPDGVGCIRGVDRISLSYFHLIPYLTRQLISSCHLNSHSPTCRLLYYLLFPRQGLIKHRLYFIYYIWIPYHSNLKFTNSTTSIAFPIKTVSIVSGTICCFRRFNYPF